MKLKLTALEQEVEKEDALRERKVAALLEERRAAQQRRAGERLGQQQGRAPEPSPTAGEHDPMTCVICQEEVNSAEVFPSVIILCEQRFAQPFHLEQGVER